MGNLTFGTSHFINIKSAILYYENLGFSAYEVREKLIEEEIHIGEPEVWAGHYLKVDGEGRFHQVRFPDSTFDPSGLNEAGDYEINEALNGEDGIASTRAEQLSRDVADALKEANKAMDNRTNRILDWIYAAREVMLVINAVMLFGIVCYLLFYSMG